MFLILFGLYCAGNIYLFIRLWQAARKWPAWGRYALILLFGGLSISFFVCLFLRETSFPLKGLQSLYFVGSCWLVMVLYSVLSLLIMDGFKLINHSFNNGVYYAISLSILLLSYGYYQYNHPARKVINIVINKSNQQSEHRLLKIVAVSDIHLGYGTTRKKLHRYVNMINAEEPDLILIGGDLIDSSVVPLFQERMQDELSRLKSKYGIYMVPGNHEYLAGIENSLYFLKQTPIQVLRDTVVDLFVGLQIIGRDDRWRTSRSSLADLTKNLDPDKPVILLDHQPYHLEESMTAGVDLQFSGHTHHGQIWPLNWVTDYLFQQSYGYRQWGNSHTYVSSGLSLWGPPFRVGTVSEMVVFNLQY